jgi:hypothetical protein
MADNFRAVFNCSLPGGKLTGMHTYPSPERPPSVPPAALTEPGRTIQ